MNAREAKRIAYGLAALALQGYADQGVPHGTLEAEQHGWTEADCDKIQGAMSDLVAYLDRRGGFGAVGTGEHDG